ncbi:conserved hypothetical protein [Trichinella spiralis]|uniref:hypothetical protein n=1 Tax=Trichinella spiralis TaxID=6334 RepID=UPI0001EFBB61|nr:conserved hypothetical protein [Trichinella spiralis]
MPSPGLQKIWKKGRSQKGRKGRKKKKTIQLSTKKTKFSFQFHSTMILNFIPQTEVMHPIGGKVKEEESKKEKGKKEEDDQLQAEANLLLVHSTMILIIIP